MTPSSAKISIFVVGAVVRCPLCGQSVGSNQHHMCEKAERSKTDRGQGPRKTPLKASAS